MVEKPGAWKQHHFASPGPLVKVFFLTQGDVGEKTGQHRFVNGFVKWGKRGLGLADGLLWMGVLSRCLDRFRAGPELLFFQQGTDLIADILPFAHASEGEEMVFAELFDLVASF